MPYKPNDIQETVSILGVAFLVGTIAQYIRQRSDKTITNDNIIWMSIASGFSAMIIIGLVYEYTKLSPSFLVALAGVAGWAGIGILSLLSRIFSQVVENTAENKFNVKLPPEVPKGEEATDVPRDNQADK